MNNQNAYILGGGSFGSRAFSRLQTQYKPTNLTVIDINHNKLEKIIAEDGNAVVMDAISFLQTTTKKMDLNSWIIPAVPIHVAYEWLRNELRSETMVKPIPVPKSIEAVMPNPIYGTDGQLYASNADFRCPDNCSEPDKYCTVTGKLRPQILYDTLTGLKETGYHSICIVSTQLAPGVGGFLMRTLHEALKEIITRPGKILVSTSCKCHCVINAIQVSYD